MPQLFFETSNQTFDQITEIFDFLWPTVAAMWNLRWQVRGYVEAQPQASLADLTGRFLHGSGVLGTNLRKACFDRTWEQQQAQFSKFLLINIFAVYESWLRDVLEYIGFPEQEKSLQYPTTPGKGNGVISAISIITANESVVSKNSFHPVLKTNKKYSIQAINNLMKCYRYFKECRNSFMHHGGKASERLENAYQEFSVIVNKADLGVEEVPLHNSVIRGHPVIIHLRGVVGFCDVILRIITTLDAELSRSLNSEKEIERRWKNKFDNSPPKLKSVDIHARRNKIIKTMESLGFPRIQYSQELENYLLKNRLVSSHPNQ